MYLTHTFANRETLSRAHSWLTKLGFDTRQFGAQDSSSPRLVIVGEPQRLDAARMLINAAENSDPDGFATFWHQASASHPHRLPLDCQPDDHTTKAARPASAIGWHPLD